MFSEALAGNSQNLPEIAELYGEQEYINALRKKSLNFKVTSKGASGAVRMDHAINVLRNVRASYTNYSLASYKRSFGNRGQNDKFHRLMKQSASEELLIADLKHASFGFSIAVDTFMMKDMTVEMSSWKTKTFSAFEAEVINLDYDSIDTAQAIASKYTKEELRSVYGPMVSMLSSANGYVISTTDSDFSEIKRTLLPIRKAVSSIVVPKLIRPDRDLRMFQVIGMAEPGDDVRKDNVLGREEINYAEFTRTFDTITLDKNILYLREPYSVKIEYNSGVFSIEDANLGIRAESSDHKEVIDDFSRNFIELYVKLYSSPIEDLTLTERDTQLNITSLVSMASINN